MASTHDIVIVGGGAGGQAVAASLHKRHPSLDIGIIEPSEEHYYQPGWTMVGGGVFKAKDTVRKMINVMPHSVKWYQASVESFMPDEQIVILAGGELIGYKYLVVAPGLTLDWGAIEGLEEALGSNGVTSNYRYDLAPYTWELVQKTRKGRAIFTQPPMPIKCAGAPQKAMYLACSEWLSKSRLRDIEVEFCNAGPVLFGVADYVPALMEYIEKYQIELHYSQNLIKVDGPNQIATFEVTDADGNKSEVEKSFDMLHVCPVQRAPEFIRESPLADAAGWLDVDQETLQHKQFGNIFGIGDINNTPNAKTAAAVRKQAPVIAENLLAIMKQESLTAIYNGYGSCPLTVERGKIVLAEFGYGGKLLPTFPLWLIEGKLPSKLSWFLKEKILPWVYWNLMLKGKEWFAAPGRRRK
ncbi:MAG: NAD(P)/FAD-dependent oxidoreductase [Alteromonadaceae bacterium]|nr:NAD(P)/FAD-dependent oxidoreductase [Alteromonadaceae bacterium]